MHATILAAAAAIAFAQLVTAQPAARPTAQPSWDTIEQIIQAEADDGFAGAVLLIRDGEVFLNKAYGLADRDNGVANTPDTLFALGSTPIDFTHVAILQLLDAGKLSLDDRIGKHFEGFAGQHARITIEHLRSGRSGLPDFPNDPAIDPDPDHSPLSRDELIERTRRAELLFPPGSDRVHSHWAWGVLAAIVEVASGQTYPEYVRQHILEPAGMTRTGFHGDAFEGERVAIGYGPRTWGEINAPTSWNETSWLVMGSGGMVGTTGDLYKFHQAIDTGVLLSDDVVTLYPPSGVFFNGNMYGFETVYNYGPGDRFYVNCNTSDPINGYVLEPLGLALEQLVEDLPTPNYSIGIGFGVEQSPRGEILAAVQVPQRKPAFEAGLRVGDELISANGRRFDLDTNPLEVIRASIEDGDTLRLKIRRGGKTRTIVITPRPMNIDD
ncbi:MAG: serine hydrolase [Phycisphaerales bacterium]